MASTTTERPLARGRAARRRDGGRAVSRHAEARAARRDPRRRPARHLRGALPPPLGASGARRPKYAHQAQANSFRTLRVPAPRGLILDRNGVPLVTNQPATAIQLWPSDLPKVYIARYAELARLARVSQVPLYEISRGIKERLSGDLVDPGHGPRVRERPDGRLPAGARVRVSRRHRPAATYLRHYPYQDLAAQVLGYVGSITQTQLKLLGKVYDPNDEIGQTGVESAFDNTSAASRGLRSSTWTTRRPLGPVQPTAVPKPGNTVRLTLDLKLQQAAEKALAYGIQLAQGNGEWAARAARSSRSTRRRLDPRDGVVPDVQAVGVLGARDDEGARESGPDAEDRACEELPLVESRDAGDVSTRLGVQAGDGACGDASAHRLPVRVPPVHGDVSVAERQVASRSSTTGTRTSTSRWTCRPRLRTRATRTSTNSVTGSSRCRRTAASRCSSGRRRSASAG